MSEPVANPVPAEVIVVHSRVVACEGGGGALGHPRVFLRISDGEITCPYCSCLYRLQGEPGEAH